MTHSTLSQRQQMYESLCMVEIPEGEFLYGSSDLDTMASSNEKPQRTIFLSTFRIARTCVTNKQWSVFLQESGYKPTKEEHNGDYLRHWEQGKYPTHLENHPVVNVSKHNADAFCSFYGLRLPTEQEWEKAVRGKDGRLYSWGGTVGSFLQGTFSCGLLDCVGNAMEWTSSPDDSSSNSRFSLRGGYYLYLASLVRCSPHYYRTPAHCYGFIGFRPAQDT